MQIPKENAAPSAKGHGVKNSIEAAKLLNKYGTGLAFGATHYWDRHSNSVQPISEIMRGVCV